ncbi:MAG TPA: hypothetical protein VMJ64_18610, partial [Anaerolineales bacterium]|nr:hypothetical protein [Anaerolineales bacterium]
VGDLARITDILVFPDEPSRLEAAERLLARATSVESALGRAVPWDEAARALTDAFHSELGLSLEPGDLNDSESRRAQELVEQKYAHSDWMKRV